MRHRTRHIKANTENLITRNIDENNMVRTSKSVILGLYQFVTYFVFWLFNFDGNQDRKTTKSKTK